MKTTKSRSRIQARDDKEKTRRRPKRKPKARRLREVTGQKAERSHRSAEGSHRPEGKSEISREDQIGVPSRQNILQTVED
jgi:hypothetical protein